MMADATTHWTTDDLAKTNRSVHVISEDRRAAIAQFESTQHRPPTSHEMHAPAFRAVEVDIAQNRYNDALVTAAENHPGVDPIVLKSLLVQESAMNPRPGRDDGAYQGIAQLGAAEATVHGVSIDRHDPIASIDAAARVLSQKDAALERTAYSHYGAPAADERTKFTLAAYNAGEGTIATAIRIAHDDAFAAAEKRGETRDKAEAYARGFATHFENLTEPRGDTTRSPLYRAAEQRLTNSDPAEKYTEISQYAEQIVARVPTHEQPAHEREHRDIAQPTVDHAIEDPRQQAVNERIAASASHLRGMSTRDSATHHPELENGNVACAYAVNQVLEGALGRKYGTNPEYVPSVTADLRKHGREVAQADTRPGDIAVRLPSHGEAHGHIGIVVSGGPEPHILSNSSSRGAFDSDQTPAAFGRNYLTGGHDQVVFLRLDPDSVHLEQSPNGASSASRKPVRTERSSRTDFTRPEDPKILGETRHGQLIESPEELATKNALLDRAVGEAKHGVKPSFRFVGDERESIAEVARQNVKLDHAVELASRAEHEERATETWTPGMSFERFKNMLSHIRGGASVTELSREQGRTPDHSIER